MIKDIEGLSHNLKRMIDNAGIINELEIMLIDDYKLSRRINMSMNDVRKLKELVAIHSFPEVENFNKRFNSIDYFTTGDQDLDDLLNGGIREQSILEIVGAALVYK